MSDIDPRSETWEAVKEYAEIRLNNARAMTEAHGLSLDETEFHRGRIAILTELLGLPERRPVRSK